MINKALGAMKKWVVGETTGEEVRIFTFEEFATYKEFKNWDLVDVKAVWNKLQENYFKILMRSGEFNLVELGIIRIVYRAYSSKLVIKAIINDSSCKPGLIKLNQICKIFDEKGLDDIM